MRSCARIRGKAALKPWSIPSSELLADLRQTTLSLENAHASEPGIAAVRRRSGALLDSLEPLLEHIADFDNPVYMKNSKSNALHSFIRASALLAVRDLSGVPESVITDPNHGGAPALQEAADGASELSAHVRDGDDRRGPGRRRSSPRARVGWFDVLQIVTAAFAVKDIASNAAIAIHDTSNLRHFIINGGGGTFVFTEKGSNDYVLAVGAANAGIGLKGGSESLLQAARHHTQSRTETLGTLFREAWDWRAYQFLKAYQIRSRTAWSALPFPHSRGSWPALTWRGRHF